MMTELTQLPTGPAEQSQRSPAEQRLDQMHLPPPKLPSNLQFYRAYHILHQGGSLEAAMHSVTTPENPTSFMDPLEVIDNHPAEVFHMRLLRLTIGQGQIMDKTIKLFTAVRDQQITARSPEYRLLSDEIDDLRKLTQGSTLDLNLRKATATPREAVHAGNPAIQHEETTWMGRVLNDTGAGS